MNKIVNLVNRVLNSKGTKLKKQNEYMYWSPFVSHHKPKLQINIQSGKWHCWVSNQGGHNIFQLFKKVGATQKQFTELRDIVGTTFYIKQDYSPPYFKTVSNYLNESLSNNSSGKNKTNIIDSIVSKMDCKYLMNTKMRDLTPSQLRWVNLAAGIIAFPKVLLIDELELHLSLNNIKNIIKILYRKSNYEGITIIATTQNKDFFKNLSSVNININHGRITSVRSSVKKKYNKK